MKSKNVALIILLFLFTPFTYAQVEFTELSQGSDILGINQLDEIIGPFITKLILFLGGAVGIYLLLTLLRVYYERKKVKLLQDIKYDLDNLNIHYDLPYSSQRKGIVGRAVARLFPKKTADEKKKKP